MLGFYRRTANPITCLIWKFEASAVLQTLEHPFAESMAFIMLPLRGESPAYLSSSTAQGAQHPRAQVVDFDP